MVEAMKLAATTAGVVVVVRVVFASVAVFSLLRYLLLSDVHSLAVAASKPEILLCSVACRAHEAAF